MTTNTPVWHEGMFLQPQHLQQFDRSIDHRIQEKSQTIRSNFWGFTELTLDLELLSIGKLGIKTCKGIFPDGTIFNIPQVDQPPIEINIQEGWTDTLLYLAIPLRQPDHPEFSVSTSDSPHRYNILDKTIKDAIDGTDFESEIRLASVATRIMSAHEDLSGYSYLPIANIKEARTHHLITLEEEAFMSVWLDAQKCDTLHKFIFQIYTLLQQRGQMLSNRLADLKQTGAAEVQDLMLLHIVNRYEPFLLHLYHQTPLHPERLYEVLLQLMGELATHTAESRRPITLTPYDHNDLLTTFSPIVSELRRSLNIVLEQNALTIPLENKGNGYWVCEVENKQLFQSAHFVIALYAEVPPDRLKERIQRQIKVAPTELIQTLVSKSLPGIDVTPLARVPMQIPYYPNYAYFALSEHAQLWSQLARSAGIAIHIPEMPELKIELWAIKG